MKLNIKFNKTKPVSQISDLTPDTNEVKNIVFDHITKRIYANNEWFGTNPSDLTGYLPLSGGHMTGSIRFGTGGYDSSATPTDKAWANNAAIVLDSKGIVIDNFQTTDNTIRWLSKFNNYGVEFGNYKMYTRLLSWNNPADIQHIISSNNTDNGTKSTYKILDTNNSTISNYSENNVQYGYTIKLGSNTDGGSWTNSGFSANVLGIGQLNPELSNVLDDNKNYTGKIKLTIGGENSNELEVVAKRALSADNASAATYAVSAGTAAGLLGAYWDIINESQEVEEGEEIEVGDTTITSLIFQPGANDLKNKIVIGEGIKIEKLPTGSTISQNPSSWYVKISVSDELLNRISTLESIVQRIISFDNLP